MQSNREVIIEILTEFANEVIKAVSCGSGNTELIPEFADRLEQQPEVSEGKTTLPQLRDKCITGTFQIGATGIKEPPSWEFHAKKLELMILNGEFNHPQPISEERIKEVYDKYKVRYRDLNAISWEGFKAALKELNK